MNFLISACAIALSVSILSIVLASAFGLSVHLLGQETGKLVVAIVVGIVAGVFATFPFAAKLADRIAG